MLFPTNIAAEPALVSKLPAVTGLILAGGRGTRVGGQDKGWLVYQGQSLIERQIARIQPWVAEVLISANRNLEQYQALAYPVLSDRIGDFAGPLAGILSGLEAMQHSWLWVISCDCPNLPADLLSQLWRQRQQQLIAYAQVGKDSHFLAALIHQSLAPSLQRYLEQGQRRVGTWYQQHQAQACLFTDAHAFLNINHIDDLYGVP